MKTKGGGRKAQQSHQLQRQPIAHETHLATIASVSVANEPPQPALPVTINTDQPSRSAIVNKLATPPPPAGCSRGEIALLVLHYLNSEFPKVAPLFRLEAKPLLAAVQLTNHNEVRSLKSILIEYAELKAKQRAHQQLLQAVNSYSQQSHATPIVVDVLAQVANLLHDYNVQMQMGSSGPTQSQNQLPSLSPSTTLPAPAAASSSQNMTNSNLPSTAAPSSLPSFVSSSTALNGTNELVLPSSPKRRRKGSSPKRRIIPQPVSTMATMAASSTTAAAAASNRNHASIEDLTTSTSFEPDWSQLPTSPFQLPNEIPLSALGPDIVAHMSIDPEGYQKLAADTNFSETLARFINQQTTGMANYHPSLPLPSPPAAGLSESALQGLNIAEIAEHCLQDPDAARFMDQAFNATVPTDDGFLSPTDSMMTPSQADLESMPPTPSIIQEVGQPARAASGTSATNTGAATANASSSAALSPPRRTRRTTSAASTPIKSTLVSGVSLPPRTPTRTPSKPHPATTGSFLTPTKVILPSDNSTTRTPNKKRKELERTIDPNASNAKSTTQPVSHAGPNPSPIPPSASTVAASTASFRSNSASVEMDELDDALLSALNPPSSNDQHH